MHFLVIACSLFCTARAVQALRLYAPLPSPEQAWPQLSQLHKQPATDTAAQIEWQVTTGLTDVAAEVSDHCGVAAALARELIDIGAVYSGLQPDNSSKITWRRVLHAGCTSEAASELCFLKVHLRPTRFLQIYSASCYWHNAVKHCCDSFVVVDKPTGVPVQPHASNYAEALPAAVSAMFSLGHLSIVHRLDTCTSGLVVLARTRSAQAKLVDMFSRRQVTKRYLALVHTPVKSGTLISHWHDKSSGMVQRLADQSVVPTEMQGKRWRSAQLRVHTCTPVSVALRDNTNDNTQQQQCYELYIELMTGRKHQIRAQLSAMGSPLVGDTLYTPVAGLLAYANTAAIITDTVSSDWQEATLRCSPPSHEVPIQFGLQAHSIEFTYDGVSQCFEASQPWWRDKQSC